MTISRSSVCLTAKELGGSSEKRLCGPYVKGCGTCEMPVRHHPYIQPFIWNSLNAPYQFCQMMCQNLGKKNETKSP